MPLTCPLSSITDAGNSGGLRLLWRGVGLCHPSTSDRCQSRMQAIRGALDPCGKHLGPLLAQLRALIEATTARRKPKIAKGTRDFRPDQMTIRKHVFQARPPSCVLITEKGPSILTGCIIRPFECVPRGRPA